MLASRRNRDFDRHARCGKRRPRYSIQLWQGPRQCWACDITEIVQPCGLHWTGISMPTVHACLHACACTSRCASSAHQLCIFSLAHINTRTRTAQDEVVDAHEALMNSRQGRGGGTTARQPQCWALGEEGHGEREERKNAGGGGQRETDRLSVSANWEGRTSSGIVHEALPHAAATVGT